MLYHFSGFEDVYGICQLFQINNWISFLILNKYSLSYLIFLFIILLKEVPKVVFLTACVPVFPNRSAFYRSVERHRPYMDFVALIREQT